MVLNSHPIAGARIRLLEINRLFYFISIGKKGDERRQKTMVCSLTY